MEYISNFYEFIIKNNSFFDRFGRKDGPGVFTTLNGSFLERGVYRDTSNFEDVYPPFIHEVTLNDLNIEVYESDSTKKTQKSTKNATQYYNPPSLLTIGLKEVARHMQARTDSHGNQTSFITPNKVSILPNHLKQQLCSFYIDGRKLKGSAGFGEFVMMNNLGFSSPESIACCGVKMNSQDVDVLCCIQGANVQLKNLELTLNKLDTSCISRLVHSLNTKLWPNLRKLDLSLNILDIVSLKNITYGVPEATSLRCLRLSNCGIRSSGAQLIASFLANNFFLEEMDLSFNTGDFLYML